MKIYIDLGHGGRDPGAVSHPFIEHEMVRVTGLAMADQFEKRGAEVMVEPGHLEITASASKANAWDANLLISVHYNAGGGDRGEVIYSWKPGSIELANAAAAGLKAAGQTIVRTYKSKANSAGNAEYFGILRVAKMPAVIIEPVFLDNVIDRQLVDTAQKQKQMGTTLATAIADAYGLEDEKVIYKTINDVPSWAKPVVQKLVARKSLQGDEQGNLNLSDDLIRTLVILDREGVLR